MKKREYSLATEKLINRMCKNVERKDYVLHKEKAENLILKTYDLFNLDRPKKVVWCVDVFDKDFKISASSASSAWSARSAWSAGSEALDYDFDYFVIEYEYCKNRKDNVRDEPNKNDKKYLQYCNLLIQAIEEGLGYRFEYNDVLYLVPDRICRIDEQNRFHNENGPSIWWKGGKEFYFIHGVAVSEKIVKTPHLLTKEDWLNEKNVEVRRIIQDRMPDFVEKIGAKKIQKDSCGELVEITLINDPEKIAKYVKVQDASTNRKYYLRVPPTVQTAKEAVAWSFSTTEDKYDPKEES